MAKPKELEAQVQERDFIGLFTQLDPHDLPPGGAQDQVNIGSGTSGKLRVRSGYRELTFEALC